MSTTKPHTSTRINQRVDEVLADYAHTDATATVRQHYVALMTSVDELLPTSGEKTLWQRKMLESAHLFVDAVEMNR